MGIAAFAVAGTALVFDAIGRILALLLTRPLFVLRKAAKYGFVIGVSGLFLMLLVVGIDNSDACKSPDQIWAKGRAAADQNTAQSCANWEMGRMSCRAAVRGITNTLLAGTVAVAAPVCWAAKAITPQNALKSI